VHDKKTLCLPQRTEYLGLQMVKVPEYLLKREDAWIGVIFGLLLNLVSNLF
jgi:hypothetical protein